MCSKIPSVSFISIWEQSLSVLPGMTSKASQCGRLYNCTLVCLGYPFSSRAAWDWVVWQWPFWPGELIKKKHKPARHCVYTIVQNQPPAKAENILTGCIIPTCRNVRGCREWWTQPSPIQEQSVPLKLSIWSAASGRRLVSSSVSIIQAMPSFRCYRGLLSLLELLS